MSHTPTPWRIGKAGGVVSDSAEGLESIPGAHDKDAYDYYGGYLIAESVTRTNAEFIVEACNAHPRPSVLFLAQRETIDRLNRENEDLHRTLDIIRDERDGLLRKAVTEAREKKALCEGGCGMIPQVNAGATDRNREQSRKLCSLFGKDCAYLESPLPNGSFTLDQVVGMLEAEGVIWRVEGYGGWALPSGCPCGLSSSEHAYPFNLTAAMDALIKVLETKGEK